MRVLLVCLALASTSACQAASVQPSVAPMARAGCYSIHWTRGNPHLPDTLVLLPTPTKRADASDGHPTFALGMSTLNAERYGADWWAYFWYPVGEDSLRIEQTDGFLGTIVRGAWTPDGFVGVAEAFSDVIDTIPPPQFPLVARRRTCLGWASAS